MNQTQDVTLLSALGNETRLDVFRYLPRFGPDGVAAKQIARAIGVAPNSLSFHLKDLKHAGLVVTREGTAPIDRAPKAAFAHAVLDRLVPLIRGRRDD